MTRHSRPLPKIFTWILSRLAVYEDMFSITRDFEIEYAGICRDHGRVTAFLWIAWNTLKAVLFYLIFTMKWRTVMFRNNLKIAFRILKRHKGYSFINIAGLTVGMACFILMMFYIQHELSFDKFHAKYDRLYRVIRKYPENQRGPFRYLASTPAPLAPTMVAEFPEVTDGTRIGNVTGTMRYENKAFNEAGIFADNHFLELFSFRLLRGNETTCLGQPFAMVITEKLSRKYFGTEDPVGKIVHFSKQKDVAQTHSQNESYDLTITGVIRDVPNRSHLRFDYLVSFITLASTPGSQDLLEQWGRSLFYNYVELIPGIDPESLHDKLAEYSPRFRGRDPARYILQPFKNLHWEPISANIEGMITNDKKNLYLFSVIAFIILIVACINYMNLATARFSMRMKEIGLRKVVGAQKFQLFKQFIGESVLFSFVAFIFAIVLVLFVFPFFNSLVDRDIQIHWFSDPWIPLIVLGMVFFAGMFSGGYPALVLSSFQPIAVLKGTMKRDSRGNGLRNVLVVFQFAVAVCLITGTLIVWQQLRYIRSTDIGYDREHVIVMPLRDDLARKNGDVLSEELRRHDRIHAVSGSEYIPLERNNIHVINYTDETGESALLNVFTCEVGYEFFDVFGVQIIEGRNFSREFRTDEKTAVLLNQTAVRSLGLKDPVGKVIDTLGHRVIGVVKDYHHSSLHDKIDPMIFFLKPDVYTFLSARIEPVDMAGTLEFLKETVKKHSPYFAFEYYFQDDYFNEKYKSDQRFGIAFGYASVLAIMIACLGVFGLISFSTERRTKEIAIRKVLGASVRSILGRLSKGYILLVALANLLAWPIAYYFMKTWLQNFAFRIDITIWTFLFAAGLSLAIALLAVIYKSLKAATADPVDSLRYE
jgi:putative ABC transport system permease protein